MHFLLTAVHIAIIAYTSYYLGSINVNLLLFIWYNGNIFSLTYLQYW